MNVKKDKNICGNYKLYNSILEIKWNYNKKELYKKNNDKYYLTNETKYKLIDEKSLEQTLIKYYEIRESLKELIQEGTEITKTIYQKLTTLKNKTDVILLTKDIC